MILAPTDEQQELAKSVRGLLERRLPDNDLRRLMDTDTAHDDEIWKGLADMGVLGLAIPEHLGGLGYGWAEVGIALEEAGRALLCGPYFATAVLATAAILAAGDAEAQKVWLPLIAAGERIASVALGADHHGRSTSQGRLAATERDGSWQLSGSMSYVMDGLAADMLVVAAETDHRTELFVVDLAVSGVSRTALPTMDLTRKFATIDFDQVRATRLGGGADSRFVVESVLDIASICLAAEAIGGAAQVLQTSVEYARTRYQFGRPIGSFQAIKHMCADMLVDVELAKSAVYHALWAADKNSSELPVAASLAKLSACDAYFRVAAQNIQVHGGVGFTWEHSAHLHLKRAKTDQLLLGDSVIQRRRIADRAEIPACAAPTSQPRQGDL